MPNHLWFNKRFQKATVLILIAALLIPLLYWPWGESKTLASESSSTEDQRIAADLSNLTGRTANDLLKMRKAGMSWNEIADKAQPPANPEEQKQNRSRLLAETGIGEDQIKALQDQGYTHDTIMETKFLAERVQFQLQELTEADDPAPVILKPELVLASDKNKDEKSETFKKIAAAFDPKTAMKMMLQLKGDFGSYAAVLDEYLLALQIGLDLASYKADKEAYLKAKEQKLIDLAGETPVNAADIELAVLQQVQISNRQDNRGAATTGTALLPKTSEPTGQSPLPDVPMPKVNEVKPPNPTSQVMNEIDALIPKAP